VVLLEDPASNAALPIWIGAAGAQAIARQLAGGRRRGPRHPRPGEVDVRSVSEFGLQRVLIRDLRDGTYFADVVLERDGEEVSIDSRPSDAIALAVRFGRPIFVDRQLFARERCCSCMIRLAPTSPHRRITVQGLSAELARYFDLPAGRGLGWFSDDRRRRAARSSAAATSSWRLDGEAVRDASDFRAKLRDGSSEGRAARAARRRHGRTVARWNADSPLARGTEPAG
jgi:bifunctional DNase/RNase